MQKIKIKACKTFLTLWYFVKIVEKLVLAKTEVWKQKCEKTVVILPL